MLKRDVKILGMLLLITGAAFVFYNYDPLINKYFPACPFYKITGLFCPGCGSQRASHYLLTGNITAALHSNFLMVLFLPFLIFYYGIQTFNYLKPQSAIPIRIVNKVWFIIFLAILFVFYWVVRNIPFVGGNFLAPH